MLGAQDRTVRVVVDGHVLRSPPEQQRKAVGQHKTDHHSQRGRPARDRPQRRLGPIEFADAPRHLAAGEEVHRMGL